MRTRRRIAIAQGAAVGALAYALSMVQIPFPLVPYLIFDLGEIPVAAVMLAGSPLSSLVAAGVYFGVMNLIGQFVPIGPALKLAAVLSMLAGLYPFSRRGPVSGASFAGAFALSTAIRVVVMTALNFAVVEALFPGFLGIAADAAMRYVHIAMSPLELVLLLTAAFNAIQSAISLIPAAAAARALRAAGLP
ncbi:MAG: hypothetical protein RXP97_02600 [Nitrososphaeria archaeon]